MATSLTSEPAQQQPQATAEEIFARGSVPEQNLSRLLVFYLRRSAVHAVAGNFPRRLEPDLDQRGRAAESISPSRIQAHGRAQVLGWLGSFILGIGYYSIPKLRGGLKPFALWSAWLTSMMWMTGVLLRWLASVD